MSKESLKFILKVAPLTAVSLKGNQIFSYLSPKKLFPGDLVAIPFSNRQIKGIVIGNQKKTSVSFQEKLKTIEKVLEKKVLTQKQIELAFFVSQYYFSPLGKTLKNFILPKTKSRLINAKKENLSSPKIILTPTQKILVKKISDLGVSPKKFLLFGPSGSGKTEVYIHSILALKKKFSKLQFLILVPEKTLIPQAQERYGQYFKNDEIVVLSSNISKGGIYANWQKIKTGKAKIIIGTRMAVFAPFLNLGLIVIDEEQDISFKQWDMSPRYDARTVAEKLAEIFHCSLIRGSATPSVASFWKAKNKKYNLLTLPLLDLNQKKIFVSKELRVTIVDMKKERWAKNKSLLSRALEGEIRYVLKYHLKSILFINRQGMSSFSLCQSCRAVLKCSQCDRALIYQEEGKYKCLHCGYISDIFPKCQKCGGIIFKNVGLGTQKVKKEIIRLFPSAKIVLADSNASFRKNFSENIYKDFSAGEADILIGTQMISKGWDLPEVVFVGIIDADNMLSFPDFSSQERAFQNMVQVAGRTNRPHSKYEGTTIIQTFQPENPIIKLVQEINYPSFWEKEIQERKALNFPPFVRMIKLIFQSYDFQETQRETQRIFFELKKISSISLTEPFSPLVNKIRGRYRKQIIIKIKKDILPKILEKNLKNLKNGWIIDVDPISIS